MTGDPQLAVDLVQDSFVRYLKHYGRQDAGSRALLFTIARNAALDVIRKQKVGYGETDDCIDPGHTPEQQVIQRETVANLLKAIGQLAPQDRELISLVATADLTYRDIAGMLNLSEANVKVRVHRARLRLRDIMG